MSEDMENKKKNSSNIDSISNGNTQVYTIKDGSVLDDVAFSGDKRIKIGSSKKFNNQGAEDALKKSSKKSEKELEYIFNKRIDYFNKPFEGYTVDNNRHVPQKEKKYSSSKIYDEIIGIMINKYGGPFTVFTLLDYVEGDESLSLIDGIVAEHNFENFNNNEFKEYIRHKRNELILNNETPNVQKIWYGRKVRLQELIVKAYYSIKSNNGFVPDISLKELNELVFLNAFDNMVQSINDAFDQELLGYVPSRINDNSKPKKHFLRFNSRNIKHKFDRIIANSKANYNDEQKANKKYQQEFLMAIDQNKKEEFLKEISSRRSKKNREEIYFDLEQIIKKYNDNRIKLEEQKEDNGGLYNSDNLKECFKLWTDYRITLNNYINKTQEEILENYYSILQAHNPERLDNERYKCKIGDRDFIINKNTFVEDLDNYVTKLKEYEKNKEKKAVKNVEQVQLTETKSESSIKTDNDLPIHFQSTTKDLTDIYAYGDTIMYIKFAMEFGGYTEQEAIELASVPENIAKFNEYGFSWSKYIKSIESGEISDDVSYSDFIKNAINKLSFIYGEKTSGDNLSKNNEGSEELSGYDKDFIEDFELEEPEYKHI